MKRQIVSELRKLRTTRTAWGLLAGLLALTALGVVGVMNDATPASLAAPLAAAPFLAVPIGISWAFVLILGLRSFTDEFRHGSIVPTLLADPDRGRVLAAKVVATAGTAMAFALAAAGLTFAIGVPWLLAEGVAIDVSIGPLAAWFAKLVLLDLLWSAIGVGIGLTVRHQVAAIAGSLVAILVGEQIVSGIAPTIARFLPGSAGAAIAGFDGAPFGPLVGATVLAAWAAAAVAAGSLTMQRRDIA
jgi:ABC-2 type transport system permease protein